jgi:preprotein translocase subunit SecG
MITFLVVLDIILAILIIAGIFLHGGNDGFMGESTQTIASNIKFETYDKIIGSFVLAFFIVTLLINYFTIYQAQGTADIDAIVDKAHIEKRLKKIDTQDTESKTQAPLAQ